MDYEFFDELQSHSEAKLKVLRSYVIPYMRKIVLNRYGERKVLIIDGFAGAGTYGEGDTKQFGSPVILYQEAIEFCRQSDAFGWKPPEIFLIFIEGNKDNFQNLNRVLNQISPLEPIREDDFFQKVATYPSVQVACINGLFSEVFGNLLDEVGDQSLIPSLCFIDPFGFSHTPFDLIKKYSSNNSAEILFNFMYEEINRFVLHPSPKIKRHMMDLFGVTELEHIQDQLRDQAPEVRKGALVGLYTYQLKEVAGFRYSLSYDIKKNGKTKMILFFGSSNIHGLGLMKNVMWNIGEVGQYMFDDRVSYDQIKFQFGSDDPDEDIEDLAGLIRKQFSGQDFITVDAIEKFTLVETKYPTTNYVKPALKKIEEKGNLEGRKVNGKKRNRFTYTDVWLKFM
ncbi:three-Cys-motif partner protein TcmP [Brevibacillus parabrevis]